MCYTTTPNQEQAGTFIEAILNDNFVGYATELGYQAENHEKASGLTTKEAVSRGYAVVDGGATQTIGSVAALEAVLQQNRQKHGSSGLKGLSSGGTSDFLFRQQHREQVSQHGPDPTSGRMAILGSSGYTR